MQQYVTKWKIWEYIDEVLILLRNNPSHMGSYPVAVSQDGMM